MNIGAKSRGQRSSRRYPHVRWLGPLRGLVTAVAEEWGRGGELDHLRHRRSANHHRSAGNGDGLPGGRVRRAFLDEIVSKWQVRNSGLSCLLAQLRQPQRGSTLWYAARDWACRFTNTPVQTTRRPNSHLRRRPSSPVGQRDPLQDRVLLLSTRQLEPLRTG